ncbi:hypothetical protein CLF_104021 [Clonorchis sinensis]|uniref:Uncharacterized protein n=1 Tax=Clonorchis sinensis TaxID=79923 RepID=G7YNQ3_CLOSI|nr:hypothetical protein CLF_104021 [Clonorchis sinensis]
MEYETRLAVLDLFPLEYLRLRGDLILTYALFEQGLANRFFTVDPANTRRGHGERQSLNDKNKTDQGNLDESLDPVHKSAQFELNREAHHVGVTGITFFNWMSHCMRQFTVENVSDFKRQLHEYSIRQTVRLLISKLASDPRRIMSSVYSVSVSEYPMIDCLKLLIEERCEQFSVRTNCNYDVLRSHPAVEPDRPQSTFGLMEQMTAQLECRLDKSGNFDRCSLNDYLRKRAVKIELKTLEQLLVKLQQEVSDRKAKFSELEKMEHDVFSFRSELHPDVVLQRIASLALTNWVTSEEAERLRDALVVLEEESRTIALIQRIANRVSTRPDESSWSHSRLTNHLDEQLFSTFIDDIKVIYSTYNTDHAFVLWYGIRFLMVTALCLFRTGSSQLRVIVVLYVVTIRYTFYRHPSFTVTALLDDELSEF